MKKLLLNGLAIATALFAVSSSAVTIINENSKTVKYVIAEGTTCLVPYSQGEISRGGQVVWTTTSLYHPSSVCVNAAGWTSTTGAFARDVKNDTCVLKVEDAGLFRGVKIEEVSGC